MSACSPSPRGTSRPAGGAARPGHGPGLLPAGAAVVRGLRRQDPVDRARGRWSRSTSPSSAALGAAAARAVAGGAPRRAPAGDRPAVGRAGGAARPDAVRRVPLGAARLQPGRLPRSVHLAALGGAPAVTFAVALAGAVAAAAVSRLGWAGTGRGLACATRPPGHRAGRALPVLALAGALLLAPLLVPTPTDGTPARSWPSRATCPEPGLDFNAERRAVLDNHVAATKAAAAAVDAGTASRSPTSWSGPRTPPTSTPCATPTPTAVIDDAVDAPSARRSLVGAVLEGPGEHISNVEPALTARAGATAALRQAAPGAVRRVHPVPGLLPALQRQGRPGPRGLRARARARRSSGCPLRPAARSRPGRSICFEVAYDDLMRDTVRAGANVLRGADQQRDLRLHRRVRAAAGHLAGCARSSTAARSCTSPPSGSSALITPDGTAHQRERVVHPALLVRRRCRCGRPPRSPTGWVGWPEYARRLAAVLLLLAAARRSAGAAGRVRSDPDARRTTMTDSEQPSAAAERRRGPLGRVVVLIPTYNERENLPRIVARVRAAVPPADVLVLDDNSPTAPARSPTSSPRTDPPGARPAPARQGGPRRGVPGRVRAGPSTRGYDVLVEMDADGSHQPEQLPALLAALERRRRGPRLPLGAAAARSSTGRCTARCSRSAATSTPGSCSACRSATRRAATAPTAPPALTQMDLHDVASQGYCFQVDLAWRAVRRGLTVVEVPITFVEREVGDSKMSARHRARVPGAASPAGALAYRARQVRTLLAPGAPVASALGPGGAATAAPPMPVRARLVLSPCCWSRWWRSACSSPSGT